MRRVALATLRRLNASADDEDLSVPLATLRGPVGNVLIRRRITGAYLEEKTHEERARARRIKMWEARGHRVDHHRVSRIHNRITARVVRRLRAKYDTTTWRIAGE